MPSQSDARALVCSPTGVSTIRPFAGIRFSKQFHDVSSVIAPPYDVLDEAQKAALQAKHPNNIVNVDLPWMPEPGSGQ